jgi:hypothetical protein
MKPNITNPRTLVLTILVVTACVTWCYPSWSRDQALGVPFAVVEGVQGTVGMTTATSRGPVDLAYGDIVNMWDTITTDAHSKLFLKWETGVLTSVGGWSSLSLGRREGENGPIKVLGMTEGVLRVTKRSGGGNVTPYMVTTPEASIEPLDYDAPVDFIVEVRSPTTSAITVISGPVKINGLSVTRPMALAVSDCHTVLVNQGTQEPRVVGSDSVDLDRLVDRTTIPGTIATDFACPVPTWLF